MVNFKKQLPEILKHLPEDCSAEDVQYAIYVNELIRRRLETSSGAAPVKHEEAERQLSKWLRK